MDITFEKEKERFNYRVCAIIIDGGKILAMRDEDSLYFYLPGGRVHMGESAEHAILREIQEELHIKANIIRPLWLNQAFFKEDIQQVNYHELCLYFLMDIPYGDLPTRENHFSLREGDCTHYFEWLNFTRLQDEYFYPLFLKEDIFRLPKNFTLRIEYE